MRGRRSDSLLFLHGDYNDFRTILEGSLVPPKILLLSLEGAVLLSVPQWRGFAWFFSKGGDKPLCHKAHWENHYAKGELVYIVLEVEWENGQGLRLGFPYPEYMQILSCIWENRAIGLLDKPLKKGVPDPQSKCMLIKDLPAWSAEVV
jgi:hypothetical protein